MKFWHNFHSSQFNLCYQYLGSLFLIVWKLFSIRQRNNFGIFSSFFIITFDENENFVFWWFKRKDLVQIYQNIHYFKFKKESLSIKISFRFFFCCKILPKFIDFVNSYCIFIINLIFVKSYFSVWKITMKNIWKIPSCRQQTWFVPIWSQITFSNWAGDYLSVPVL